MSMHNNEIHDHLFLHCHVALACTACLVYGEGGSLPRSIKNLCMIRNMGFGSKGDAGVLWGCAGFSLLWNIWIEQNAGIFRSQKLSFPLLWEDLFSGFSLGMESGSFPWIASIRVG